ncbi:MAG: hypothetical protein KF817_07890 [Phycisphaeraceae bacterium]|nr:hypothetical protein [Phycisphaeraceae bacterium]
MTSTHHGRRADAPATSLTDTLQSLIVAFVLAMMVRAFVCEGFVIPTGSMAPTLMGRHLALRSSSTGVPFPVGLNPDDDLRNTRLDDLQFADPYLGPQYPGAGRPAPGQVGDRLGDRILVHKSLYLFRDPHRFDVVVFKNPTNPLGPDGNYIKRLVGLPDEVIWLVDGDVFVADVDAANGDAARLGDLLREVEDLEIRARQVRASGDRAALDGLEQAIDGLRTRAARAIAAFSIARKPDHVQRAVWQPIYDSARSVAGAGGMGMGPPVPPWFGDGYEFRPDRTIRRDTAESGGLEWEPRIRRLDDWAYYNQRAMRGRIQPVNTADLRVQAVVEPDTDGLDVLFEMTAREHQYQCVIGPSGALVRFRSTAWGDEHPDQGWQTAEASRGFSGFRPGRPTTIEFSHVDQRLSLSINGRLSAVLDYPWDPAARLEYAFGPGPLRELADRGNGNPTFMRWRFGGSPFTIHRMQVDRDLHYRAEPIEPQVVLRNPTQPGYEDRVEFTRFGFGTHPDNLAILGPADHFMLGDNSTASSDSRAWGNPHPLVAEQIDRAPFVVHRDLLLGKAWVVYFPSPLPLRAGGSRFVPDFGSMRFIR